MPDFLETQCSSGGGFDGGRFWLGVQRMLLKAV